MTTIARLTVESADGGQQCWAGIAARIAAWTLAEGIALRDAVVLLPFAQLLPPARRAFADAGGWMPRIETTKTLAASLGPTAVGAPGQISFDSTFDALSGAALLRSQPWGAAWARRDPRGFEQTVRALVGTAHELARATFPLPPAERPAHWAQARAVLVPVAGPGATERLLLRVALEWACLAAAPATDRLFSLVPPSAWIAVQAGGPDALTERLMADAMVPCLVLDTDVPMDDPFSAVRLDRGLAFAVCDSFEHEAQCAAAQVLEHVRCGEVPVALIAQDRVLVRRVRALLEREPLYLLDETGWKLSTTRAAAQVMSLLLAAGPDATTEALLDWLKTGTAWTYADAGAALAALEAACRKRNITRAAALHQIEIDPTAGRLWASAATVLDDLFATRRQPLPVWLTSLAAALAACGAMVSLQADDAGRQVIKALRLVPGASAASAWAQVAGTAPMDFDEFRAWIDEVLEQATFLPSPEREEPAQVVITPLARAMLRPFAAIVCPGADDKRLGASPASSALFGDAQAAAFGVPTVAQRRDTELLAFAQLMAMPRISLMRRRVDGNDPLGDSPLVERLSLALAVRGAALVAWPDPRVDLSLAATPIHMSAPSAVSLLPSQMSASSCEALRACPYRFFALNLLQLREDDEIEREIEKRDYGTWLHAVLLAFHQGREVPAASEAEVARLMQLARTTQHEQGLSDADFLPFAASFESFAPRYIAWLHARDGAGARWLSGEDDVKAAPAALEGTGLHGIIDRIDEWPEAAGSSLQLIDYKTGGATGLIEKVKQPLEDTQLAFYAALMRTRTEQPLRAIYLALDGRDGLDEIEHPGVEGSAAALVEGLANDLRRLRAGAGLPALGEGATCDYCAARGICRRDHWSAPAAREEVPRCAPLK